MDIFDKLVEVNQQRKQDTPEESLLLDAMRKQPSRTGKIADLMAKFPAMKPDGFRYALVNLTTRGKVRVTAEQRWHLLE